MFAVVAAAADGNSQSFKVESESQFLTQVCQNFTIGTS